jgi:hypothetical protein
MPFPTGSSILRLPMPLRSDPALTHELLILRIGGRTPEPGHGGGLRLDAFGA